MERMIILKVKDGNVEKEYSLKVAGKADKSWSRILEYLFNEDSVKMKDVVYRRIFVSCPDETLVTIALGSYTGSLPAMYLERIMNRFPNSEDIQLGLALYCAGTKNKEFLNIILKQPATEHVKQEVEFILETL